MHAVNRVQGNIVARQERRFLDWSCRVMPERVTSDHLTVLGVIGAVLVFTGYVASRADPHFLWVSTAGYVIHWVGDSLDGSLARFRNVARPRYGYFLDHSVDALCIFLMIGGMGLSTYVRLDVALLVVVGYFALSIHVFLKSHVTGTFQLSFMALGPTEVRMVFVALTIWMLAQGNASDHLGIDGVSGYDIALIVMGTIFFGLFLVNTVAMVRHLRALEGDGRRPLPAIAGRAQSQSNPDGNRDRVTSGSQSTAF